jgi:methyl-accepting chemotaxis protein
MKKLSMNNMSIKQKILFSYGVLLALTIIVSLLALIGIKSLNSSIIKMVNTTEKANNAIDLCQIDINIAARNVREMALNPDTSTYTTYQNNINEEFTDLENNLADLEESGVLDEETYQEYMSAITKWMSDANNIVETIIAGNKDEASELIFTSCTPALADLEEVSVALEDETEEQLSKSVKVSQRTFYCSMVIVLLVTILAIAGTIIMGKNILKAIAEPLVELEESAKALSEGNLHVEIAYESNDELGSLAESLRSSIHTLSTYVDDITNAMDQFAEGDFTFQPSGEWKGDFVHIEEAFVMFEKQMADMVIELQQVAEQVESGAQQVSSTSMELAQGATDQATVMQQFASTLEDVSSQVSENAEYADGISKRVGNVGVEISATNDKMRAMVQSMNEIEESSQKIRQIIDTINDVASQTNLLALNASIEAARAGEFGRGFAVVANQVTALATQSADAAKESTQLIEASIKEVENGMMLTNEIAKQQEDVAVDAQLIVDEVEKVAKTLKSQDESFLQLNEGIVQINDVIQTNSATSQECAASSMEMSEQAGTLDGLVRGFKVANAS